MNYAQYVETLLHAASFCCFSIDETKTVEVMVHRYERILDAIAGLDPALVR